MEAQVKSGLRMCKCFLESFVFKMQRIYNFGLYMELLSKKKAIPKLTRLTVVDKKRWKLPGSLQQKSGN